VIIYCPITARSIEGSAQPNTECYRPSFRETRTFQLGSRGKALAVGLIQISWFERRSPVKINFVRPRWGQGQQHEVQHGV
jgi:hypothetical protein